MIISDLPYNQTDELWDHQITSSSLTGILKQADAANHATSHVIILWHKSDDTPLVKKILYERHYKNLQQVCWYKDNHYVSGPQGFYVNSWEMCTIGFQPNQASAPHDMSLDPRKRHNFISCPSVTTLHKKEDGTPVNPCQKPSAVAKWLISNHCGPGGTVLVIGHGAGGEVFGAIEAGCNVVAVEHDSVQHQALVSIIHKYNEDYLTKENARIKKEERDKKRDDQATLSKPSANTNPNDDPNDLEGDDEDEVTCESCAGVIEDAINNTFTCNLCNTGAPLHEGCCKKEGNEYFCEDCVEKRLSGETQEVEEDE